jgi:hypothetical protein
MERQMSEDQKRWFQSLGVEPPDDSWTSQEDEDEPVEAADALKILMQMCGVIKSEAIDAGFSDEEAFDMAMTYYGMFLGAHFAAAQARQDGEEEG